jgi:autophagy-related protein 5
VPEDSNAGAPDARMSQRSPRKVATSSRPSPSTATSPAAHHRSLIFDGSCPLQISLDAAELPAGSDRTIESFYVRPRRLTHSRQASSSCETGPGPEE